MGRPRLGDDGQNRRLEEKVAALEKKLADKDEVIAEIMESHVRLKKVLAKPEGRLGGAGQGIRFKRLQSGFPAHRPPWPTCFGFSLRFVAGTGGGGRWGGFTSDTWDLCCTRPATSVE